MLNFIIITCLLVSVIWFGICYLKHVRMRKEIIKLAQEKYFEVRWAFINSADNPDDPELSSLKDRAELSHRRLLDFATNHSYKAADLEEVRQWEFAKAYKQIAYADARSDPTPLDITKVLSKK